MPDSSLQPTSIRLPTERLEADFFRATCDALPDPTWHFRIILHNSTSLAPQDLQAPTLETLVSLALFQREDPASDLEIYAQRLDRELDPTDWLNFWAIQNGMRVVARRVVPGQGGAIGDMVARWEMEGQSYMGRLVAMKFGPRLVLAWFRARAADYPALAVEAFVSLATLEMLDGSPGLLAEGINTVNHALPTPWQVVLPASWRVEADLMTGDLVSLKARPIDLAIPPSYPHPRFAMVVAQRRVNTAEQAFALAVDGVHVEGMQLASPISGDGPPAPGFTQVGNLVSVVRVNGLPYELRCRIQQRGGFWMSAAVLTPGRDLVPLLWMRGKRLLDIAAYSFTLIDGAADSSA